MAQPIVTGITGYVCEHSEELLTKSMLGAKSASLFRLMPDVKGPTNLHLMDVNIAFGDGAACAFTATGSTEFSNRVLTPAALSVNMEFCDKNLLGTYAEHQVKMAAGREVLPFEQKWCEEIAKATALGIEKMIYQGDTTNGNEFDGLLKTLGADASVNDVVVTGGTAYAYIKAIAAAIPAEVKAPVILVSIPVYREFMQDLVAANLFHYDPANGENEYMLPGTDIKVIAVAGLNGATNDAAIAADLNNIVYGVSASDDSSVFDLWYSKDDRIWKLAIDFVAGVQYAFGAEIVLGNRQ